MSNAQYFRPSDRRPAAVDGGGAAARRDHRVLAAGARRGRQPGAAGGAHLGSQAGRRTRRQRWAARVRGAAHGGVIEDTCAALWFPEDSCPDVDVVVGGACLAAL